MERMFAAFPAYLYLNASLGGALLAPLLEFQSSQTAELPYAAQDIGKMLLLPVNSLICCF